MLLVVPCSWWPHTPGGPMVLVAPYSWWPYVPSGPMLLVTCTLPCHEPQILELWAKANLHFCKLLLSGVFAMVELKYARTSPKGLSNVSPVVLWGCVEMLPQGNSVLVRLCAWSDLSYKDTRVWRNFLSTRPWIKDWLLCISHCIHRPCFLCLPTWWWVQTVWGSHLFQEAMKPLFSQSTRT